jgi:hypothetical protein
VGQSFKSGLNRERVVVAQVVVVLVLRQTKQKERGENVPAADTVQAQESARVTLELRHILTRLVCSAAREIPALVEAGAGSVT